MKKNNWGYRDIYRLLKGALSAEYVRHLTVQNRPYNLKTARLVAKATGYECEVWELLQLTDEERGAKHRGTVAAQK